MFRFVLIATVASSALISACRVSLEDDYEVTGFDERGRNQACIEAGQAEATFANVQTLIFEKNCGASRGCHGSIATESNLLLTKDAATSYPLLVNRKSEEAPAYTLVTPNQPDKSYLLLRMHGISTFALDPALPAIPKSDWADFYMPQNDPNSGLCIEKRELVQVWIATGAEMN